MRMSENSASQKKRFLLTLGLALVTGLVVVVFAWESAAYKEQKLSFEVAGEQRAATLILPKNHAPPYPVVVFVHGDGAMPYDAYGYYKFFWNRLAARGIASLAWDKAGVGDSSGNWLHQSMENRADEVIAAIDALRQREDVNPSSVGLIGYSQAGWVMPLVSARSNYPDFIVSVSGAINWLEQGDYITRLRLSEAGLSETEVQQSIAENRARLWAFAPESSYEDYLKAHDASEGEPMSKDRYLFAKLNWRADARESLATVTSPLLAVFGADDKNVDVTKSATAYQEILTASGHTDFTIKTFPDTQHSLLKTAHFNTAYPGISFILKLELLGEAAFADGVLGFITEWIVERSGG